MTGFDDLLELQQVDTILDQLRHRLDALPERAAQAKVEAALAALAERTAEADARRDLVRREQKRHEDEVATVEARIEHVRHQLYDSGITSPKAAADLQADLDSLDRRRRDLEDLVLEQMELAEPIDAELSDLAAERTRLEAELDAATAQLGVAAGEVGEQLAAAEARRPSLAEAVPADLLTTYDAMRPRLGGVAVARLSGSRCDGCHLTIPSAELEQIRRAPADAAVHCPECTRLLVR